MTLRTGSEPALEEMKAMDEDMKLALLVQQVEQNADELERLIASMRASELGDAEVLVSREALVEASGFDACVGALDETLTRGALRA